MFLINNYRCWDNKIVGQLVFWTNLFGVSLYRFGDKLEYAFISLCPRSDLLNKQRSQKKWEMRQTMGEPGQQRHRGELTSRRPKIPSEIQELQNGESSPQYYYIHSIFLAIMINHEKIVNRHHGFPGDLDHSPFRPRFKLSSFFLRDKLTFYL